MKPFATFIGINGEGVKKMNGTESEILEFASVENVFKKYADMVYRLAFVRTKNIADSEDILQEVFLRYMKTAPKIESEEHLKATLLKITVNCSNSLKTSAWFKKTDGLTNEISYNDNVNDSNVLEAVLKLPQKYRTVIHLHYYFGYSVNEMSDILKINPSTLKTHLSRARALLKKLLGTEDL